MKLLVVGFDGMTPNLLYDWIDELPAFKEFQTRGVWGNLTSVSPPMTGCAWPSFFTGMEPANHGFDENTRRFEDMSYLDVKVPKLWEYLNAEEYSAGMLNIPLAYPLGPLDGYMVPGRFGPITRITDNVRELFEGYRQYPIQAETSEAFLKDQIEVDSQLLNYTLKAAKAIPTDFLGVVFNSSDMMGHWFWGNDGVLQDTYSFLNNILRKLIDEIQPDNIIIMSDHGMNDKEDPLTEDFHNLLAGKGDKVHLNMLGWHQYDGVFLAMGKDIISDGTNVNSNLIDIAPTILDLFDILLPEKPMMDGRIMHEIMVKNQLNTEEKVDILHQLRALGYAE